MTRSVVRFLCCSATQYVRSLFDRKKLIYDAERQLIVLLATFYKTVTAGRESFRVVAHAIKLCIKLAENPDH